MQLRYQCSNCKLWFYIGFWTFELTGCNKIMHNFVGMNLFLQKKKKRQEKCRCKNIHFDVSLDVVSSPSQIFWRALVWIDSSCKCLLLQSIVPSNNYSCRMQSIFQLPRGNFIIHTKILATLYLQMSISCNFNSNSLGLFHYTKNTDFFFKKKIVDTLMRFNIFQRISESELVFFFLYCWFHLS